MKNRHGACRGPYLAISLGLIVGVTVYATSSGASDALKPLDQQTTAAAPRFNPQAVFDLLGLKRIDYPAPGQRPQQHPREPAQSERSHPSVEYEGRKAQAALSIVSFQVAGEMRGEEAESVQQLTKQDADEPIDTLEPSTKSQPDDSQQDFEQLVLSPPTINEGSEELPGAAMPESEAVTELAEDGSFDLTVSSVLAASDNHRPRLPDAMESEEGMSLPNMALVDTSADDTSADDTSADDTSADDPNDGGSTVDEDISSLSTDFGRAEETDERVETSSIDPWADPTQFEPATEANNTGTRDRQVDRLSVKPRPPFRSDRAITPIESGEPMPGPPPVTDQVVSYQAQLMIADGIQLARRGAIYSARAKFIRALRLITQAFDAQGQTRYYSECLAHGFRALEEVNDFRPKGSRLEADLDLERIVQSHRTPVLHTADFRRVTSLSAQQAYHTYAENQLIEAVGRDPVAADALFALGKVQWHLSEQHGDSRTSGDAKSMSLYQAALTVHPDHHHTANELGVLLARYGQFQDARAVLRHCVRDRTNFPEVWRNLARVHERLGEAELARRANKEYRSALQSSGRSPDLAGRPKVEWVDAQTFAKMSRPNDQSPPEDILVTQQHPEAPAAAMSRRNKRSALPSATGQPLTVGQRYGR